MAVGPQGIVTFVGTRKTEVWAVTDRNKDGMADEVKNFAPSLAKSIPNGPCFSPDGMLYIAEQNRVLQYPAAEFFYESPDVVAVPIVPQGELIPPEHESFNHTARVCRVGPDGKLYIALGQPYNVTPADLVEPYKEAGIGGIIRMGQDGKGREVFATGIRNSVGIDFQPGDRRSLVHRQPGRRHGRRPCRRASSTTRPRPASHFGFPWYGGGHVRTNEYKDETPPEDIVFPVVEMAPHAADLGMTFYTG